MTLNVKTFLMAGTCALLLSPVIASARVEVTPYIEVTQILDAQIRGGNEVVTYSSAAAGVDASIDGQRTQAQLSYRYERRFGWGKNAGDSDVHSGLARISHEVIDNMLSLDAGALATRGRGDIRGGAATLPISNTDNITQVYSVYGGPTLSTHTGPLEINAAYRLGYTSVEANDYVPAAGQPRLDNYDHSVSHLATASVGMAADVLPFGWQVAGAYEREDTGQLDQRYESKGVRGDITVPVTPTVALLGGVGYENISASERAPLLDGAGDPVVDAKGRFVTDPASPRLASYDFDGIYWDVGVGWKPSRRTSLEAHVGRRYGSMSYTGSFTWAPSSDSAFQLGVYDEVQTYGQQIGDSLASLPTKFNVRRSPLGNQFGGCVFGGAGAGAGGCLNGALQSSSTGVYRSRGVAAQYGVSHGPLTYGVGVGYAQRDFKAPTVPGAAFALNNIKDEAWYGQADIGYRIDQNSSLDASVYASLYDSGIAGAPSVTTTGATGAYSRLIGRHLSATAAVGLYSSDTEGQPGEMNASASFGMRYSF